MREDLRIAGRPGLAASQSRRSRHRRACGLGARELVTRLTHRAVGECHADNGPSVGVLNEAVGAL
jgi:hypothetical protein